MMPVAPPPEHLHRPPLDLPERFCRPFSLAEILSATHNFDESLVIGKGGFGKVYKGVIDNGASIVAIKRLSHESKQGESQFRTEIEMLSKFRHSHIVSLIGYCYSSTEMTLVYQYMVNGSLADHLYKSGKYGSRSTLSWVQRLKICLGAARGLDYLHTAIGVQDSIVHRDMKSSNILLDKNFAAKVSDFGLSRICPIDQSCTHIETNVKGTRGYVDPEYMLTFKLTRKSDVYSFGVVLFEVLCGRRAVDFSLDEEQWNLARWAQYCCEKGTLHRIIDPNLRWEILPESFTEFGRIANQCLCYKSKKRPTMTQVVASLELALALQLGRKDSSAFEMEIIGTSETDEIIENVGSTMVQKDAIKSRSRDEDNNDVPPSHVNPRDRKGLSEMLQPSMFSTDDASDPLKVVERVQRKSHRQVELLSLIPKPPADEPEKPKEAEIAKPEEKKEEPKVIIVVLKVHMHCEACAQEIKKRIQRVQGVENADPDLKSSQLTVKGVFDPQKLVEYVYKRTGKQAVIVNQEPEKKEENGEGEKKVEERDAKKGEEGEGESKEKKKEGGEEGAKTEGDQAETTVLDIKKNESYYYPQNYQIYNPVRFANGMYYYPLPAPQMFSDENPHSCSVM